MTTRARYRALSWFADHDQDATSVLFGRKPTKRMINLMLREGQLLRIPTKNWLLTDVGRRILEDKNARSRRRLR